MMEVICPTKMLILTRATWHHIPETAFFIVTAVKTSNCTMYDSVFPDGVMKFMTSRRKLEFSMSLELQSVLCILNIYRDLMFIEVRAGRAIWNNL
jgi:hypothetical protein